MIQKLKNVHYKHTIHSKKNFKRLTKSKYFPNYEYLFNLTDGAGGDPGPGSLFCIQTLKSLINLGIDTPNIIFNTSLVLGTDFTFSSEWDTLT